MANYIVPTKMETLAQHFAITLHHVGKLLYLHGCITVVQRTSNVHMSLRTNMANYVVPMKTETLAKRWPNVFMFAG